MGATLRVVNITLGLVTLPAKVKSAVKEADTKLNVVCTGHAADVSDPKKKVPAVEHAPAKVRTRGGSAGWLVCPVCENDDRTTFAKGKDVGGLVVVVPQDELDKFLADESVQKTIALTAHETAELADAMPAGKVYWIDVEPPVRKTYALFVRLLKERPDISYVAEFAVRSLVALYKLDVIEDALCIRELAWPEQVEAAPESDLSLVEEKDLKMAIMIAETALMPFNASEYRNQRADSLAAFLASAEGVEGIAGVATTGAVKKSGIDLSAQLEAALAAATAGKAKRVTKQKKSA